MKFFAILALVLVTSNVALAFPCKLYGPTYRYSVSGRDVTGNICLISSEVRAGVCDIYREKLEHFNDYIVTSLIYQGDLWVYEDHHQWLKDLVTMSDDPHFSELKLKEVLKNQTVD